MPSRKTYGTYSPLIKAAIAASGRVDLFPHLKIPRATAQHWINQGYTFEFENGFDSPVLRSLVADLGVTRQGLKESQAIIGLLKSIFESMGFKLRLKQIESTKTREKILEAITVALKDARLADCLKHLDLSLPRYKRWNRAKRGCGLPTNKFCPKGNRLNQLTF